MPSNTKIIITSEGIRYGVESYRIDCTNCGVVDTAWPREVIARANVHNKYVHNHLAQVVVPVELTKGT